MKNAVQIPIAIKPRASRVINDLREALVLPSMQNYTHLSYIKPDGSEILEVEISQQILENFIASTKKNPAIANAEVVQSAEDVEKEAQSEQTPIATAPVKPFNVIATFNSTHIKVIESAIANDTPVLLVGHTGLGKTTLIKEVSKKHGKNLIRLSVHSGVTTDEILGKWIVENGSMVWQNGLLVQAMLNGDHIVFDEINACPPDVMFAMHALLDDDRHVTLLEKKGEIIRPHKDFRFFATMNPQEDYAGTKEINMAFMSRFNAVIEITPFPKKVEESILVSKGIPANIADGLVSTATMLREMKKNDEIMYFCGTRDLIHVGLLVNAGLNLEEAIKYGIANKMSKDDKEHVKGKLPNVNYKSPEEVQIENLSQALQKERNDNNKIQGQLRTDNANLTKQVEDAEEKLKQTGAGNANLDAKTQKALKILGVLA